MSVSQANSRTKTRSGSEGLSLAINNPIISKWLNMVLTMTARGPIHKHLDLAIVLDQ